MVLPMQISLEEVITMLLSRVESLAVSDENGKTRFNVVTRALYKKGLVTDEDIMDSVREEHHMLKELGMLQELPGDDVAKAVAEGILQWIRGDVEAIRQAMEEYDKKLREYAQESRKSTIAVASSDVLHQLDRMAPPPGSNKGSKLIL